MSATYFLNRPCIYCSLLLFILVVALFDFQTPWFEPPLSTGTTPENGTGSLGESVFETAAVFVSAANNTAQALMKAAVDGLKEKIGGEQASAVEGTEWAKGLWGKKEWRIPCLDVLVRF